MAGLRTKGSPTNYGIAGQPVLPLYYHSSDPGREIITSQTGPKPLSYFMDTGGSDSRRMVKQDDERSIWAMAKGYVGGVSAYLKVSDLQALSPGANPANWVWSYCRMSATDYERDSSGRVIWRPIVPVPVSAALIAAQTGTGGNLVAEYATGGGVDPPVDPEDPNPPIEGWSVQPDITHNGTLILWRSSRPLRPSPKTRTCPTCIMGWHLALAATPGRLDTFSPIQVTASARCRRLCSQLMTTCGRRRGG